MVPVLAKTLFGKLWIQAAENLMISSVVTDSRAAVAGSVFVAIKGERVDGHDFARQAMQNGATVVLAQHFIEGVPKERTVLCADILDAMIELGANYRSQYQPLILAITGSVGKTTTKEFSASVLSAFDVTLKTEGNQNNEIGLPNTLFRLDDAVRYAVLEMGMHALGEIHKLSVAVRPDAAIITRIGTAHMGALGSIENILKAKLEICDGLPQGAPLMLNGDDPLLRKAQLPTGVRPVFVGMQGKNDVCAENVRAQGMGQYFTITDVQYGSYETYIPAMGKHNLSNALLAYTAVTRLGLNSSLAAAALANYRPTGMRQAITQKFGATLIEDCYNASPESMQAALSTLAQIEVKGRRIAVLGDMLELGKMAKLAHENVGGLCAENGIHYVITVGKMAALIAKEAGRLGVHVQACQSNTGAAQVLNKYVRPGDAVLFKASRGMKFEEIIEKFNPSA